ncbi:hypothetical protein PR048_033205 [Dryococelus australis]|uniref:Uncharacterized protein n=1 Tax=Dryococelus australis TaxID=614101 RepID=A0ABQ9FZL9_9NEOP|nr:hypothetical protein PR048_033205 [Dryococelus australis]
MKRRRNDYARSRGGGWGGRIPGKKKTRRPTASPGTTPTCESPVTRPGIEPGSPWWEASGLIAQPPKSPESQFSASEQERWTRGSEPGEQDETPGFRLHTKDDAVSGVRRANSARGVLLAADSGEVPVLHPPPLFRSEGDEFAEHHPEMCCTWRAGELFLGSTPVKDNSTTSAELRLFPAIDTAKSHFPQAKVNILYDTRTSSLCPSNIVSWQGHQMSPRSQGCMSRPGEHIRNVSVSQRITGIRTNRPAVEPTTCEMRGRYRIFTRKKLRKHNAMSACTRQEAKSKYRNRIRLERASQKRSSDTHKISCGRVKRCRERQINIKAPERVNRWSIASVTPEGGLVGHKLCRGAVFMELTSSTSVSPKST